MRKKRLIKICVFVFIVCFLFAIFMPFSFAATPKLVTKLSSAFKDIKSWLLKLATPAAAVAVAVGAGLFMKKFSFGDEERIRMSKKIIRGSFVAYALFLALDLILSAIESLI